MALSNRERVAAWRKRLAKHGFKPRTYVVHQDDAERVKNYIERVRKQRIQKLGLER